MAKFHQNLISMVHSNIYTQQARSFSDLHFSRFHTHTYTHTRTNMAKNNTYFVQHSTVNKCWIH